MPVMMQMPVIITDVSVINMKEDSSIYAFVIIVLKMTARSPNFGGTKWHTLFYKSRSKNNLKSKNQFQQASPGAQN